MTEQTKHEPHIEGNPAMLPALVSAREVKRVRAQILSEYGFEPTDRYCADLIAFVDSMVQPEQPHVSA